MKKKKLGIERAMIMQTEGMLEDYVKKVITSHLGVSIEDDLLTDYTEKANRIYPDKKDFEIAEMNPVKLGKDLKKCINDAVINSGLGSVTVYGT